jgi:hypothetical protein
MEIFRAVSVPCRDGSGPDRVVPGRDRPGRAGTGPVRAGTGTVRAGSVRARPGRAQAWSRAGLGVVAQQRGRGLRRAWAVCILYFIIFNRVLLFLIASSLGPVPVRVCPARGLPALSAAAAARNAPSGGGATGRRRRRDVAAAAKLQRGSAAKLQHGFAVLQRLCRVAATAEQWRASASRPQLCGCSDSQVFALQLCGCSGFAALQRRPSVGIDSRGIPRGTPKASTPDTGPDSRSTPGCTTS